MSNAARIDRARVGGIELGSRSRNLEKKSNPLSPTFPSAHASSPLLCPLPAPPKILPTQQRPTLSIAPSSSSSSQPPDRSSAP